MLRTDADLAAEDLAEVTELGVEVLVVPVHLLEALDKDARGLNILATWLSSDSVEVVRQSSRHEASLDAREPEFRRSRLLGILNALEHDESIVKVLEEWPANSESTDDHLPLDADLARTNVLLVVVSYVEVTGRPGKVSNVDHAVGIVLCGGSSELHSEKM